MQHIRSATRWLIDSPVPINPEAWRWYRDALGGNRTPVVDTWWQTEALMISPLPGVSTTIPGSAIAPVPGISANIVGIWGDPERYKQQYWSRLGEQDWSFAAARATTTTPTSGCCIDDVMNVSAHRTSTAEVQSALVGHSHVAEAAVVGATDDTTGQAIIAFVILESHAKDRGDPMVGELKAQVAKEISPIARPREIHIVPELPKTRSGKIMRRLLRDVAEGRELGDTSTLVDPSVFEAIRASKEFPALSADRR